MPGGRSRGGGEGGLVKKAGKKLRAIGNIMRGDSLRLPGSSSRRRPPSPSPPPRRGGGRRLPSPSPVEDPGEDEEDRHEDEDEEGKEHEDEEGEELPEIVPGYMEEEEDDRIWEPPEEYVEPEWTGMPGEAGQRKVYQRGVAHLPELDDWRENGGVVTLTPTGESSFLYKEGYRVRTYSSILGCLVRHHWPGSVTMPDGRMQVAWTWEHYAYAPDPRGTTEDHLENCQARVMYDFWRYFLHDPDFRKKDCTAVAARIAKKQVTDSHYEGRILSVRNWYAKKRKLRMTKSQARNMVDLQPWQYLQCPPPYIGKSRPKVWSAMVNYYTSKAYKKTHEEGKVKRAAMGGGSHSQGSIPLAICKHLKGKEEGAEVSLFKVWGQKHKTKDKDGNVKWVSKMAEVKDDTYRKKFAEKYGDKANPETTPFDPEVAMVAGEGRKNGRLWLCDGAVDLATVPSMRAMRHGSTSSSPAFEVRPTASSLAIDSIREELETERRERQQAQALLAQHQQQMTIQQQMMLWMTKKMSAYDAYILAALPTGATLPTVDPPPFDMAALLQASLGSNNARLGGRSTQDETQMPPTGGSRSVDNPLARSLF